MKRQRSRNRGSSGNVGGNGKPQQNANRAFDSNGPEGVKVRGAAQHVYEKYQQLARDAASSGDRVLAENYLQHAEHYFRTIRTMQPMRPAADILGSRDQFVSGYDMDYEEEPTAEAQEAYLEAAAHAEAAAERAAERQTFEPRQNDRNGQGEGFRQENRPRDDRPREEYRQRDDRPRDDRPRDDRPRDDRPRDDRPRDDRPRDDRPQGGYQREDRPQNSGQANGQREDRPQRERYNRDDRPRERYNRDDRPRPDRDPMAVVEPQSTPLVTPELPVPTPVPAPVAAPERARVLRGQDGAASEAPAFLQNRVPAAPVELAEAPKKPRRKRVAAPKSDDVGAGSAAEES